MALMQKMTLGQATKPGDGKLGKLIKRKVSGFKMKQAQRKLENRKEKLESGEEAINRGNKKYLSRTTSSSTPKMDEVAPSRAGKKEVKDTYGIRQPGERKYGKYANPLLYKMETVGRNIKDKFEQAGMRANKAKGRKRGMADAAGPTSRNKDVMVCKEGQCQTR